MRTDGGTGAEDAIEEKHAARTLLPDVLPLSLGALCLVLLAEQRMHIVFVLVWGATIGREPVLERRKLGERERLGRGGGVYATAALVY